MKRITALLLALLCLTAALPAAALEPDFLVFHGDRSQKRIAITVDDCYDSNVLRMMYELSVEEEVPLTFFVLGKTIRESDKEVWEGIIANGGEVGSHSLWHHNLAEVSKDYGYNMIMMTQQYWDAMLGYHYPLRIMRPPYGDYKNRLEMIASTGTEKVVLWDVSNIDPVAARRQTQNGSILLYHTNYDDLKCLRVLIPQLKADGYELVTVSELLGMEPIQISDEPFVYHH